MILMDFNQIVIASTMMAMDDSKGSIDLNEGLIRSIALDSIRANRMKFHDEYGEIIVCCDDGNYWRKNIFPYYKARREKERSSSKYDWNVIYDSLNMVREELEEYFPYKVIRVPNAEADDIIGTLCIKYGMLSGGDPILILSGDKDFKQLQMYRNVTQYDQTRHCWLECETPRRFLNEHIIRGDPKDGIPNIRSVDDIFLCEGKRQKPIMQVKLDGWLDRLSNGENPKTVFDDEDMARRFKRNQKLIDLFEVPPLIQQEVMEQFHQDIGHGREKLFNFFVKYKLKTLTSRIGDF